LVLVLDVLFGQVDRLRGAARGAHLGLVQACEGPDQGYIVLLGLLGGGAPQLGPGCVLGPADGVQDDPLFGQVAVEGLLVQPV
jgi:hypothetical protein